jgi:hypothetical protein
METAVMIDGAFIRKKFRSARKTDICAPDVKRIVTNIFTAANIPIRDYRVYFYDCKPCSEKTSLPISHSPYDFEKNQQYTMGMKLIKETKLLPFFCG